MASIGGAAAQGLEAGFGMGMQLQQQKFREDQAAEQSRRADEAMRLQRDAQARLEARQVADLERQTAAERYGALKDEHKSLVDSMAALQQSGQPIPEELNARAASTAQALRRHRESVLAPALAQERQQALDFFSKVQSGQADPYGLPPAQLYRYLSLATGRTPEEVVRSAQGAQQVAQGFQTGNQGLMLQGVNALVEPELRTGIGQPSPHGGTIIRKEVVGLVPVKDANGVEHPDKVFPVIRVFVKGGEAAGPAMENGATGYYDAPLTQNRSSDPNDPVKAIDLNHAFDYMGRMGALASVMQDPRMQEALAAGSKEVGAQTRADLDEYHALGHAAVMNSAKGAYAQFAAALRQRVRSGEMTQAEADDAEAVYLKTKAPAKAATGGVQTLEARLAEINKAEKEGQITPQQANVERSAARSGLRSPGGLSMATGVPVPAKPGAAKGTGLGGAKGSASADGPSPVSGFKFAPGERLAASKALVTGNMPYRKAEAVNRLYAAQEALGREAGLTNADMVKQGDNYKVKQGALQDLEKMYAAVESFSLTVDANMKVLEDLSKKLPRSDIPIISKGVLAVESFTGNPVMSQYRGAMQSVATEVARLITQPRLTGQLTDSARKEIKHFMNEDMTHAQLVALIKTLRTEAKNREAGILAMRGAIQAERTGIADKLNGPDAAAPATGLGGGKAPAKGASDLPPGFKLME